MESTRQQCVVLPKRKLAAIIQGSTFHAATQSRTFSPTVLRRYYNRPCRNRLNSSSSRAIPHSPSRQERPGPGDRPNSWSPLSTQGQRAQSRQARADHGSPNRPHRRRPSLGGAVRSGLARHFRRAKSCAELNVSGGFTRATYTLV